MKTEFAKRLASTAAAVGRWFRVEVKVITGVRFGWAKLKEDGDYIIFSGHYFIRHWSVEECKKYIVTLRKNGSAQYATDKQQVDVEEAYQRALHR